MSLVQRLRRKLLVRLARAIAPHLPTEAPVPTHPVLDLADLSTAELAHLIAPVIDNVVNHQTNTWGPPERLTIDPTAAMVNTTFNTVSGAITIGEHTFAGHHVSILTGNHDSGATLAERALAYETSGRDIHIGRGVWLGSRCVVLGPCRIGDHAVIAAGAVVVAGSEVLPGTIFGGVPARPIGAIEPKSE